MNVKRGFSTIVYFLLLAGIMLTSCSEEDNKPDAADKTSPVFSAGIQTRAADASWHLGDYIGITMLEANCNNIMDNRENCKYYTPGGDGKFTFSHQDHTIYYPLDGCDVDFIGYYPYKEQLTDHFVYTVDISNQKNLTHIDLMTFDRYCGASKSKPEVTVNFKHRLTKLLFKFTKGNNTTSREVESMIIDGMHTVADYHLIDNTFEADAKSQKAIALQLNDDTHTATAIVLPRAKEEGVTFTIVADDDTEYEVKMSPDLELKAGNKYVFNVLLREKDMPAVITATIADWEDGGESNHEIELVSMNPGEGTSYGFVKDDRITLYHETTELTTFVYDGNRWISDEPLYWDNIGDGISEKVLLKAIFTRSDALNETQMPEVMLAEEEVTRFETLDFHFHIVPSKLVFNFTSEGNAGETLSEAELKELSVRLVGYKTEYTLQYGVFTVGAGKGTINVANNVALIIPQTINGEIATLTFKDREYKVSQAEEITFEAGKVYTFNVNITRTAITSFSASYTDWVLGGEVNIDATPIVLDQPSGPTTGFEAGDEVVLYYDGEAITSFTYDGNKWSSDNPVYWENLGDGKSEKITLQAMYIRKSKLDDTQLDEVMLAEKEVTRFGGLSFEFSLVPSKIIFEITSSDGTFTESQLQQASIKLIDLTTGYTLSGGKFTTGDSKGNINVVNFMALIIPQSKSGKIAELTLNNNVYALNLPSEMTFEAGHSHKIKVNMNKNRAEFLSMSYVDWKEGGGATISATPVNLQASTGTTTDFKANDEITLYSGTTELATYIYNGSGGWTPKSNPLYWENVGDGSSETVPITAMFKRADAANDTQLPEVFLASTTATRYKGLTLSFGLVPAKVIFSLTSTSSVPGDTFTPEQLSQASIKLPGYVTGYTLSNGVFTKGSTTGDITVTNNSALIIPQTKGGDIALVTLTGNQYRINNGAEITFVAGEICRIDVNITKTGMEIAASYTDWDDDGEPVTLTPFRIAGETKNFVTNDQFSLYYEGTSSNKVKIDDFTYQGSDVWKADSEDTYWEGLDNLDSYNFYAVSTLKSAPTNSNQMDDVMYAKCEDVAKFGLVTLGFTRKTAKIVVTLASNIFADGVLENAVITLPNYTVGGHYEYVDFVSGGSTKGDIKASQVDSELKWTALIEGQGIAESGTLFTVNLGNGDIYHIKADKAYTFVEGNSYTFKITINKSDVKFSASYSDWEEVEDEEIITELD